MIDDWDEETWRLVRSLLRDPRQPRDISVEVLCEYEWSGTLEEFQELITTAIAKIPPEYRDTAVVELERCDSDGFGGSLSITYTRPQNAEELAENVRHVLAYVEERKARDRAEYERLKVKFET